MTVRKTNSDLALGSNNQLSETLWKHASSTPLDGLKNLKQIAQKGHILKAPNEFVDIRRDLLLMGNLVVEIANLMNKDPV